MPVLEDLTAWAKAQGAEVQRSTGGIRAEWDVATRTSPGVLRHLRYRMEIEVDAPDHTVILGETLWERAATAVVDLGADLHDRDEAYRIGSVWERSVLGEPGKSLAQLYDMKFDFDNLKHRLEKACDRGGYKLRQLIPL